MANLLRVLPPPVHLAEHDRPREQCAIRVLPWPDPVIDSLGFDPRTAYVERFWLGVLGPTSTASKPEERFPWSAAHYGRPLR